MALLVALLVVVVLLLLLLRWPLRVQAPATNGEMMTSAKNARGRTSSSLAAVGALPTVLLTRWHHPGP